LVATGKTQSAAQRALLAQEGSKATTHTPGPWYCKPTAGDHDFLIYPEGPGNAIAIVRDFDEANARLIAAAPELLAACEVAQDALMAALPHADRIRDILFPALREAQAAIAKATT